MHINLFLRVIILLMIGLANSSCKTKAIPIEPVKGLPAGTDGLRWWNDTVFYEIFVRSFYDSDGNGIGDLNGITAKLDYLNDGDVNKQDDLGVTGIWLMPINPSASYHGYDVTDYYDINHDYGTIDDFKRLIEESHKRGIRVIIDMVFNHTAVKNPWFIEARDNPVSPRHDWYIWSSTNPNYLGPWSEKVWYPSTAGWYYAIFWVGMPDLNYTHPEVTAEMHNVARYWLEDVGVDGFRLDAARYLIEEGKNQADTASTHQWWADFRSMNKNINPDAMTIGEVWTTNYSVVNYVRGNELDMAFNFDLASQIMRNIDNRDATNLGAAIQSSYKLYPKGSYATFLTNHDQERVMSAFMEDKEKARLAAEVLMTIPGTPFIYYGEEIGMTGDKPDERIRTPMSWSADKYAGFSTIFPWENINNNYEQFNVANEAVDSNSLLSLYRKLIDLRNQHSALRVGDYTLLRTDNAMILPFLRMSKRETLMVLINMSEETAKGYKLSLTQGALSGKYNLYPLLGEGTFDKLSANANGGFDSYLPNIDIPANSIVVIQLR